jgi:hypothetical protein
MAKEGKQAFLREAVADFVVELWAAMKRHASYNEQRRTDDVLVCGEHIKQKFEEMRKALREIISLRGSRRRRENDITPEMIERARAFPFAQLYEFKRNMARCPFHEDRTPSMALMKDNRVHCFGACSKSWDTIAFIRDREGLSFPEAVRRLQ